MRLVVGVRDRKLGKYDEKRLAVAHLLPNLLNKTQRYRAAEYSASELLLTEQRANLSNNSILMETEGELATALWKNGDEKGANYHINRIMEATTH